LGGRRIAREVNEFKKILSGMINDLHEVSNVGHETAKMLDENTKLKSGGGGHDKIKQL
jgi:hypothetical protein